MGTVCLKDLEQSKKGTDMSSHSFLFLRNGRRLEYDLLGWQICFKIRPWYRYVHCSTPTEYTHPNADLKYSSIYLGSSFELRSPYQSNFWLTGRRRFAAPRQSRLCSDIGRHVVLHQPNPLPLLGEKGDVCETALARSSLARAYGLLSFLREELICLLSNLCRL